MLCVEKAGRLLHYRNAVDPAEHIAIGCEHNDMDVWHVLDYVESSDVFELVIFAVIEESPTYLTCPLPQHFDAVCRL